MAWPPPLFLVHEHLPWQIDASAAGVDPEDLDELPWEHAFAEMADLEGGAVANPDEHRQVGHFWLRAPELAPTVGTAQAINTAGEQARELAAAVRAGRLGNDADEPFTDVLHLGIGGSALGPQLLVDALGEDATGRRLGLPVHFVDNVDPDGIARTLGRLGPRLRTTLVVVVSKSGTTAEPRLALDATRRALARAGVRDTAHLVAITQPGSTLAKQAEEEGWRAVLPLWDWVGGRFSITSAVGLLPGELAGIDTAAMLSGAHDMDAWTRAPWEYGNPAAVLAGAWYLKGGGAGARDLVILPYADRLEKLGRYLQQLVMESLGKERDRHGHVVYQGLSVYGNKGSTDQHAFVQQLRDGRDDAFVHFVQVLGGEAEDPPLVGGRRAGDQLQGFLLGTRRALAERGRPTVTITVPKVDPYTFGGLVALFERAVGLYASLIDVNAYHQPGVEAGKKAASGVLDALARLEERLATAPGTVTDLARAVGLDPVETFHLLQRLAVTDRATAPSDRVHGVWSR